jgi:hypothetical protein
MLRSASRILGYRLTADDGEVGRCVDFLLEQPTWIVRYVLVDVGARLDGARCWSPRSGCASRTGARDAGRWTARASKWRRSLRARLRFSR